MLEVLPGDGGSIGNLAAREALGRAAGREISEEDYEEVKERLVALGLVRKGRGRGGAIGLAEGIEGGSRYEAPAAPAAGNGRGRAMKEAPAKDFKTVLWASADKLRAQMDAAEYKHLVLGLIFLKYISDTFAAQQSKVLLMVSDPDSDNYTSAMTLLITRHPWKTVTTTPRRTCSGCLLMLAGNPCGQRQSNLRLVNGSIRHWLRSKTRTQP